MKKKFLLSVVLALGIISGDLVSAANFTPYTVQSGDTSYLIAKKCGISTSYLKPY